MAGMVPHGLIAKPPSKEMKLITTSKQYLRTILSFPKDQPLYLNTYGIGHTAVWNILAIRSRRKGESYVMVMPNSTTLTLNEFPFCEYRKSNSHSKIAICGDHVIVGSFNLTSYDEYERDLALYVEDAILAKRLRTKFLSAWKNAPVLKPFILNV